MQDRSERGLGTAAPLQRAHGGLKPVPQSVYLVSYVFHDEGVLAVSVRHDDSWVSLQVSTGMPINLRNLSSGLAASATAALRVQVQRRGNLGNICPVSALIRGKVCRQSLRCVYGSAIAYIAVNGRTVPAHIVCSYSTSPRNVSAAAELLTGATHTELGCLLLI